MSYEIDPKNRAAQGTGRGDDLHVKGDVVVDGEISVGDGTIFTEPLTLEEPLTVEDNLEVQGDADLQAVTATDVTATGTVQGADLTATDDLTVGDDATIAGDIVKSGASGSKYTLVTLTAQASVAADKITFTDFIPAGSLVLLLTGRVTTEITATASVSFKIGESGDDDRWGASNALTAGTTVAKGTVANIGGIFWAAANTTVIATGNAGDDLLTGALRISALALVPTAPTA